MSRPTRLGVTLITVLLTFAGVRSADDGQDQVQTEEARRNAAAAAAFAQAFGPPESAAYVRAFRAALEAAYELPVAATGVGGRKSLRSAVATGGVDEDERYRRNLAAMLQEPTQKVWGGTRWYRAPMPTQWRSSGTAALYGHTDCAQRRADGGALPVRRRQRDGRLRDSTGPGERVKIVKRVSRITCPVDLTTMAKGDIALMFLERDAAAAPRRLATSEWIDQATSVRAVGFGRTEDPIAEPIGIKRQVDVPVASTNCLGHVNRGSGPIPDASFYGCGAGGELVAGAPLLDRDSCNGDSGGPIYIRRNDGHEFLVGVTSRAVVRPGLRPCGDGGIYARVDGGALQWMRQQASPPPAERRRPVRRHACDSDRPSSRR